MDDDLLAFTRRLIAFRREHPVFRRRRFLGGVEAAELGWFTPAGTPMTGADWADSDARSLAIYLDGADDPDPAEDGIPLLDNNFLVLVNAWWEPLAFVLPGHQRRRCLADRHSYLRAGRSRGSRGRAGRPVITSPSAPGPSWCSPTRTGATPEVHHPGRREPSSSHLPAPRGVSRLTR